MDLHDTPLTSKDSAFVPPKPTSLSLFPSSLLPSSLFAQLTRLLHAWLAYKTVSSKVKSSPSNQGSSRLSFPLPPFPPSLSSRRRLTSLPLPPLPDRPSDSNHRRVYVPYDSRFPKHFHGLGIRIEVRFALAFSVSSTSEQTRRVETDALFSLLFVSRWLKQDEVLVLPEGPMILTSHAPKEIVDVEAACQRKLEMRRMSI